MLRAHLSTVGYGASIFIRGLLGCRATSIGALTSAPTPRRILAVSSQKNKRARDVSSRLRCSQTSVASGGCDRLPKRFPATGCSFPGEYVSAGRRGVSFHVFSTNNPLGRGSVAQQNAGTSARSPQTRGGPAHTDSGDQAPVRVGLPGRQSDPQDPQAASGGDPRRDLAGESPGGTRQGTERLFPAQPLGDSRFEHRLAASEHRVLLGRTATEGVAAAAGHPFRRARAAEVESLAVPRRAGARAALVPAARDLRFHDRAAARICCRRWRASSRLRSRSPWITGSRPRSLSAGVT